MADIERRVLRPNLMRDKDSDEEGPHPGDGPDSDFSDDDDGALDGVGASGGAGGAGEEMTVMPGATGLPEPVEDVAVGRHKTGPKGVIEDYRQHKRQERIKRERDELKRAELIAKTATGTVVAGPSVSYVASEATRADTMKHRDDTAASDDDGAAGSDDEEDDEFLREYRARRMAQMRALSGIPSYGGVKEISKASFVEEVDRTDPRSFVVVHLYETFIPNSVALNQVLPELASRRPHVKFLRLVASDADESYDHITLPTLLIYKAGETVDVLVRVCDELRDEWDVNDIDDLLAKKGLFEEEDAIAAAITSGS